MENTNQIKEILNKYIDGTATSEEVAIIETWYISYSRDLGNQFIPHGYLEEDNAALKTVLMQYVNRDQLEKQPKIYRLWKKLSLVAAAVLLMAFGTWYFSEYNFDLFNNTIAYSDDVKPGKEGATLTLANGKKIKLNRAAHGQLSEQAGVVITKTSDDELVYNIIEGDHSSHGKSNILTTAHGESYKIGLPDGSIVWLNAGSSLTFPVSFKNEKQRKVKLTGEAYFEIAKDKNKPFLVVSRGQTVEVLGTNFNINSYEDETAVKTTLVEGSVKVLPHRQFSDRKTTNVSPLILSPDQQSVISVGEAKVVAVNAQSTVAWTKGLFIFNDERLGSILLNISRWYNIDIEYEDENLKEVSFWGMVTKHDKLSKVLQMLEKTKTVKFSIEGKKVIVKNVN